MSAGKHTPGPWFIYRAQQRSQPTIRNTDGIYVMDPGHGTRHASIRQEADAILIAEAPDLLDLLTRYVRQAEVVGDTENNLYRTAKALVVKLGETP